MKFLHLLPAIAKYLNHEWVDFLSPSLQLFPTNRGEAIQKALIEMNLGDDEANYVYLILNQYTFSWLTYDESWTVRRIAEIAEEPAFNEKYVELNRIPTADEFLLSSPPLMPVIIPTPSESIRQKRKSEEEMHVAATIATLDFLASQGQALKRMHATATAATVAAMPEVSFQLELRRITKALNAKIGGKVAITQLIDSVPVQHLSSLLQKAKGSIARSLMRRPALDESRVNKYFYFFKAFASKLVDPQEKFKVVYGGLELLVSLIKPIELAAFVQKHLDSLDENERENFVEHARVNSSVVLNEDLAEVVKGCIAMFDQRRAATSAFPRARAF